MEEGKQRSTSLSLWIGVLLPPIVWAIQMQTNYALVPFRCYGGTRLPLYVVSTVALLMVLFAGVQAYSHWQRRGLISPDEPSTNGSAGVFLAVLGLLISLTFGLVIIAQLIATVILHPCLS